MPETRVLFRDIDAPGLPTLEGYRERGGYRALERASRELDTDLLAALEASGLRGRGGAGFSMGKKGSFLPRGEMEKYLCCNADESEPGTFKDRELMQKNPHQLIEGCAIAALAVGATYAFIFIRGEYWEVADVLDRAVAEAYAAGYLGSNMLGTGARVELVVHRGAGAYICGEETALLDSLEGKRGNPRLKPPFPAIQGLYGGPTLINNVETLSNVPHIVNNGADWFTRFGSEQSAGTKVVSVSGCVQRPGNYEIELGIPAREIVHGLAGGPPEGRAVKAWFPGGSSAPVLTGAELDLPYTFEAMAEAGSMLGSGAIIVADETISIPELALRTARFYQHESCGKCTPCREGTNWTAKMLARVVRGEATPMDLDIVASVQENIIGHCLCVLGDSMAMPVGSMVAKFRDEFEEHINNVPPASSASRPGAAGLAVRDGGRRLMAERPPITIVVDGEEVEAGEGEMLVDAAKGGDVEIPVFCYEPKLGGPVGACRMCLVEVEGIPKLQTACSTPVRDGMVVYTQTDRVKESQRAVVEFLLVNHPLDCPVCDKGGECPLQDIAMGWGPGRSRSTDPKRHFRKPVPLSPLVRIDRERCILCYRCVRFSQEVAEDEQLQLLDRGADSFVGTFDDHPYIAPFHGNIIELCPVGALTSEAYRFRARPWDIEDSGSICTLCPNQCNVKFTVRDERVERVLARDNHDVDDGWLCDKGRFGFQMIASEERITEPRLGGSRADWDEALDAVAERLRAAGERTAAIIGGGASNEEGYLSQRIVRGALGGASVACTDELDATRLAALSAPELSAAVADLDRAESILVLGTDPLHSMPILDLRLRKAIRQGGARVVIAAERPTALDGGAEESTQYPPGSGPAFVAALAAELADGETAAGRFVEDAERLAGELRPGATVVIWGERLGRGPGGPAALESLLSIAGSLECSADGAGLIGVPDGANGRGLREVGCLPAARPGLSPAPSGGDLAAIRESLIAGDLDAVLLVDADPIRDLPDGPRWRKALNQSRVIAVSMFENESAKLADVILPAEAFAEKEGTVTHPDGRLQRLRQAVPRPGRVRPVWQALVELSARLGDETGIDSAAEALAAIASEVPFYADLTPDEIGGRGIRWQERPQASGFEQAVPGVGPEETARAAATDDGDGTARDPRLASSGSTPGAAPNLLLGTYRDLWAGEATDRNPALAFLAPEQRVELAADDAARLGVANGDEVEVRSNGTSLAARVALRERIRPGAAFLIEGTATDNANALANAAEIVVVPSSDPGTPGGEAEEVPGSGSREVPGSGSREVPGSGSEEVAGP